MEHPIFCSWPRENNGRATATAFQRREASGGLCDRGAAANAGEEEYRQQENDEKGEGGEENGVYGEASARSRVTSRLREMSTEHIGAAGDRLVHLVDCVSAQHDGIAADSGLRVDYGVAADDGSIVLDATGYVEVSEEHDGPAGEISLYLHGTEDAGGVMHLLAGRDEDVLPEVDAIAARLRMGGGWKQKHEAENPNCAGKQSSPLGKETRPMVVRRIRSSGSAVRLSRFDRSAGEETGVRARARVTSNES